MKLKHITSSILALILTCSACINEDSLGNRTCPGEPISVALTIAAGSVTTKNGTPEENELKINNLAIAIYHKKNGVVGDYIDFKYDNNPTPTVCTHGDAYLVKDINAVVGDVQIVVIANSTKTGEYLKAQAEKGYTTFKQEIEIVEEGNLHNTHIFDPATLVKYGEEQASLKVNPASGDTPHIELTQLPAKIKMEFKIRDLSINEESKEINWGESLESLAEKINEDIGDQSGKPKSGTITLNNGGKVKYTPVNHNDFEPNGNSGSKYIQLDAQFDVAYEKRKYTWSYDVKQTVIKNIMRASEVFLKEYSGSYTANSQNHLDGYLEDKAISPVNENGAHFLQFYTYEKGYYANNTAPDYNPVKINVAGDIVKKTEILEKKEGKASAIYEWITDSKTGYGNGIAGELMNVNEGNLTPIDVSGWEPVYTNPTEYNLDAIVVNPIESAECNTYGLIHGNYYYLTANITIVEPQKYEFELEYAVVPWNKEIIDIPTFE